MPFVQSVSFGSSPPPPAVLVDVVAAPPVPVAVVAEVLDPVFDPLDVVELLLLPPFEQAATMSARDVNATAPDLMKLFMTTSLVRNRTILWWRFNDSLQQRAQPIIVRNEAATCIDSFVFLAVRKR
jgi:hypothetical protein